MLSKKTDTFFIAASGTPTFYEADAKNYSLWQKKEQKSPEAWAAQYRRMGGFVSRKEALDAHNSLDTLGEGTRQLMIAALSDPFYGIKNIALAYFAKYPQQLQSNQNWVLVEQIAQNENHKPTRAGAIDVLAKRDNKKYLSLYKLAVYDSSYTVAGAALDALTERSINDALKLKENLAKDADGRLASALDVLDIAAAPLSETDNIIAIYKKKPGLQRVGASKGMILFAARQTEFEKFKAVLSPVFDMYKRIPAGFGTYKSDMLSDLMGLLQKKEQALKKQPKNTELVASVDWLKSQIK
jgi:aminopeptidase N